MMENRTTNRNPQEPGQEPLFTRAYPADEIPKNGVTGRIEASESERGEIAAALDLAGLEYLRMNFQLDCLRHRCFRLTGTIEAAATQTCVVSLVPVETALNEKIEIDFMPPEDVARIETEGESEAMSVPFEGPEPIQDGIIDVGQLAYEHLAASLDLYPKSAGAAFEWDAPVGEPEETSSHRPFAGLARMKRPPSSKSDVRD